MVFLTIIFYKNTNAMKRLSLILHLFVLHFFSQKNFIIIKDSIRDVLIDDYENIYVYRNKRI